MRGCARGDTFKKTTEMSFLGVGVAAFVRGGESLFSLTICFTSSKAVPSLSLSLFKKKES